jgi:hypothetical protein
MYAVAFFAVASLVLGLWSEPTVAQPRATSSTLVKTDSGAVLGVAAGNGVLPHRGGRAPSAFRVLERLGLQGRARHTLCPASPEA